MVSASVFIWRRRGDQLEMKRLCRRGRNMQVGEGAMVAGLVAKTARSMLPSRHRCRGHPLGRSRDGQALRHAGGEHRRAPGQGPMSKAW